MVPIVPGPFIHGTFETFADVEGEVLDRRGRAERHPRVVVVSIDAAPAGSARDEVR